MPIAPGTRLGPYEVTAALGAGGLGEVYKAHDTRLGRDVAIKVLPAHLSGDAEALSRFEREARAVAALNHPNIVALFDVGHEGSTAFAVTELLEGQTLRDRLAVREWGIAILSQATIELRLAEPSPTRQVDGPHCLWQHACHAMWTDAGAGRFVCLALLAIASVLPPPPPPTQQQPAPIFKGRVDLVTLDVTVVDKDGHPVTGLAPGDFVVTLEGQRRPVQLLDYLAFGGPAATGATAAATGEVANGRGTAKISRGGRVVMVLFDDLSFRPLEGKGFTVAAERALGQFGFDDLVGLVTSSGMGPAIDPTRDRSAIAAALHDKRLMGRYDDDPADFYIAVNDEDFVSRECGLSAGSTGRPNLTCPSRVEAAARALRVATIHRVASQLAAYRAAIRALAAAPAPRVLVVVSAGLAYGGDPSTESPLLGSIGREAAEAGVQVFALSDAADPMELASPGLCPTVECQFLRAQARRSERRFLLGGLDNVASATGGELFRTVGTPDRFYARIVDEISGLYRLGVQAPPTSGANRFLNVNVAVNRKGVTVLANRHALLPSVTATSVVIDDALKSRLALGGVAFGVPIALATARRHDPVTPGQIQLAMNVELPANTPGPVATMFSLVSDTGQVVKSGRQTLPSPEGGREYRMAFAIPIGEGGYQLRFAVADANGNIGSVERGVTGSLSRLGVLAVSDLFTTWAGDDDRQQFLALERLPVAAKTLRTLIEMYPDDPAAASPVVVRLTVRKSGESAPVLTSDLRPERDGGTFKAEIEIPVSDLAPGAYTVEAAVIVDGHPVGSVFQFVRKSG